MALPTRPSADDLTALSRLTITTTRPKITTNFKSKKKPFVVDSWEDEADEASSGSATETETDTHETLAQARTHDLPDVPPPTPASPLNSKAEYPTGALAGNGLLKKKSSVEYEDAPRYGPNGEELPHPSSSRQPVRQRNTDSPDKRPDKTTSVAARLIAGGLGVRAPKRTDEEREYDRVMKEKARKKREEEKEREKAAEAAAKKSAWED